MKPKDTPVGSVRPSQLLWTFGPGSLVDLPNVSVVTMGLDHWEENRCEPIVEARLLDAVKDKLGDQVERLRKPPTVQNDNVDPRSAEAREGVPVRPFPRWLRCVRCGLLSSYDSGLFVLRPNLYRPEKTHFVHEACEKGHKSDAVPARFLLACRNGHLDDFPWHYFVHKGDKDCRGTLRFKERGASLQTENLWVQCDACGSARSLVEAFGEAAKKNNLPRCRGRHPHLDIYESGCTELPRPVLLGSASSWFSSTISVLAIPHMGDTLAQMVADGWEDFEECESEAELRGMLKGFRKRGEMQGIGRFQSSEIWAAIQAKREGGKDGAPLSKHTPDVKRPEWQVFTHPDPPTDWPEFHATPTKKPKRFQDELHTVLLVNRLREVNALVGYTRVEPPEETPDSDEGPTMARLCEEAPTWVPACEVRGEGIFLHFEEANIAAWEQLPGVIRRDKMLRAGHKGWRERKKKNPDLGYPGIRYAMLHTLAHLLIREMALECGYNEASIRERVYAESGSNPMAGILLYTASPDSDGTLGGLVDLGKHESLERLMVQALRRASVCSSDPLCSEHDPSHDRSRHAASCHACSFVAETSCEKGNSYLDRALLIPTFEEGDAAFFGQVVANNE